LLNFQAQNAARTTVHDEASDFSTPDMGQSQWMTPVERARVLKRQQQVLREQEWNARPEYERRREMVSLDIVGGKLVKRYQTVETKLEAEGDKENAGEDADDEVLRAAYGTAGSAAGREHRSGAYSNNPLLGHLVRPKFVPPEGLGEETEEQKAERRRKTWRRVQDDYEDNEGVILDGGMYGTGGSVLDADRRDGDESRSGRIA
jgi:hypothetical protein